MKIRKIAAPRAPQVGSAPTPPVEKCMTVAGSRVARLVYTKNLTSIIREMIRKLWKGGDGVNHIESDRLSRSFQSLVDSKIFSK